MRSVGLLTCDVTRLGVVIAADAQPIEIREGRVDPVAGDFSRRRIFTHVTNDFAGFVGYVGTEEVGGSSISQLLHSHVNETTDADVATACAGLASRLGDLWAASVAETGLWVFIAGVTAGEPVFRYVNNIYGMEGVTYYDIRREFQSVNDLDEHLVPHYAEYGGEPKMSVLLKRTILLRNGHLQTTLEPLDDFTALMDKLYHGRYPGFRPFDSIQGYAAVVRMRCEFVKRLHEPDKALFDRAQPRPIDGPVAVCAAALDGSLWKIPHKDLGRPECLRPPRGPASSASD